MKKIIEVNKLVKSYGSVLAVNDISFDVEKGDFFAFLGTNGAGKSTTINILTTLVKQNSGNIYVNGHELGKDDLKIRNDIGVVFQNGVLDDLLTVKENLMVRSSFYKLSGKELKNRIAEAARITECHDIMNRRYGKLSGGQKRRVDIARAIINRPKLLFLDEPTIGLDVVAKERMRSFIREINQDRGVTVILTTHDMSDIEKLCQRMILIDNGQVMYDGELAKIKETFGKTRILIVDLEEDIVDFSLAGVEVIKQEGNRHWLKFNRDTITASQLISRISENYNVRDISIQDPEIEVLIRNIYENTLPLIID